MLVVSGRVSNLSVSYDVSAAERGEERGEEGEDGLHKQVLLVQVTVQGQLVQDGQLGETRDNSPV